MKKALLLLSILLLAYSAKAANLGRDITITRGQTITLDLASDLGITINYDSRYIYMVKNIHCLMPRPYLS